MGRRNEMHWSRRRERTCCALGPGRKTVWLDRQGDTGKFGRRQATSCSLCRPWWAACTLLSMQDMSPAWKLVPHRWLVYYLGHSLWLAQAHPTWLASRGCHGGRCSPLCRLLPPPSSTTAPPLTVTFFFAQDDPEKPGQADVICLDLVAGHGENVWPKMNSMDAFSGVHSNWNQQKRLCDFHKWTLTACDHSPPQEKTCVTRSKWSPRQVDWFKGSMDGELRWSSHWSQILNLPCHPGCF